MNYIQGAHKTSMMKNKTFKAWFRPKIKTFKPKIKAVLNIFSVPFQILKSSQNFNDWRFVAFFTIEIMSLEKNESLTCTVF